MATDNLGSLVSKAQLLFPKALEEMNGSLPEIHAEKKKKKREEGPAEKATQGCGYKAQEFDSSQY